MVSDQADFEFDTGLLGETKRGGIGRIGDADNDIGFSRMFAGQKSSQAAADLIDVFAENDRIRTREIYVFENTKGMALSAMRELAF